MSRATGSSPRTFILLNLTLVSGLRIPIPPPFKTFPGKIRSSPRIGGMVETAARPSLPGANLGSGGLCVWRDAGQVTPFPSDL